MSIFRRPQAGPPPTEERGVTLMSITGGGRFIWTQDGDSPLRSVAHWAARHVLCTSIAGLPVQQIRESRGGRVRVTPSQIVDSPSGLVDQQAWVYQVVDSWLDVGNVYGDITATDTLGRPTQVEVLPPDSATWYPADGRLVPHVDGKERQVWPRGDLWHVAYIPRAGTPVGLSPSQVAAQSVATSQAAEKFGGDFFAASGHPTYDVAAKVAITAEQAELIKDGFLGAVRDRRPWVHGSNIEAKAMSVDPKASQFIELLQFECLQAARIYRVPPTMIYAAISGQAVTYANASQDDLAFLKYSLRWPLRRFQYAWSKFLPVPQVVRFNVDALLEMTTAERTAVHKSRLETKTRTVNEVRVLEDEEPFNDARYDEPGIPGPTQLELPMGANNGGGDASE